MTHVAPLAVALAVDVLSLRTLRLARALTQQDLARLAGVSRITISRLERGAPASPYSVRRIAEALSVEPSAIAKVIPL